MSWHELRYTHTQATRAMLAMKCAPATANKALSAKGGLLTVPKAEDVDSEPADCNSGPPKKPGEDALRGARLLPGEFSKLAVVLQRG